jgi:hypothetical protein
MGRPSNPRTTTGYIRDCNQLLRLSKSIRIDDRIDGVTRQRVIKEIKTLMLSLADLSREHMGVDEAERDEV